MGGAELLCRDGFGEWDVGAGESCESGASAECGIDGEESEGGSELLMVVEVEVSAVEGSGVMDGDVGLSSSS
jgi:hypothetical protein